MSSSSTRRSRNSRSAFATHAWDESSNKFAVLIIKKLWTCIGALLNNGIDSYHLFSFLIHAYTFFFLLSQNIAIEIFYNVAIIYVMSFSFFFCVTIVRIFILPVLTSIRRNVRDSIAELKYSRRRLVIDPDSITEALQGMKYLRYEIYNRNSAIDIFSLQRLMEHAMRLSDISKVTVNLEIIQNEMYAFLQWVPLSLSLSF